jgi:pimeloyl-ACP methyl ester carboxylesterase
LLQRKNHWHSPRTESEASWLLPGLKKTTLTVCFLFLTAIPAFSQTSPNQTFFTASDRVKLHYIEAGQGQALLFIPGWLMPADVWEKQIQELSKNYHVIALDPRSQGLSDMTTVGNNPLRRSQDIQELLTTLHLDSVVLVGWSLGAYDALAYLDQFGTDKLYALVLVDSPLAPPSGPAPTQRSPFLRRFINDREKADKSYVWSLFKKEQPLEFYKNLDRLADRIPTDIALATLDNTQPGGQLAAQSQNSGAGASALRRHSQIFRAGRLSPAGGPAGAGGNL